MSSFINPLKKHEVQAFNPPAEKVLNAGASLIVMGEVENLDKARKVF